MTPHVTLEKVTAFGRLMFDEGILYVRLNQDLIISPAILEEIHETGLQFSEGTHYCSLADLTLNVTSTSEARVYAANNKYMVYHIAYAMVGKSVPVNLLANAFINWNRPNVPTRLFKDETKAVSWLQSLCARGIIKPGSAANFK